MNKSLSVVSLVFSIFIFAPTAVADVNDLSVTDYQLVVREGGKDAFFEYTFTVTVNNDGGPLTNVVGSLTSSSRTTIIMDGNLELGDIAGGSTTSTDTIKFRQDRRMVFNPNNLFWEFSAESPPVNTAPVAVAGEDQSVAIGSTLQLDGSASFDEEQDPLIYNWTLVAPAGSTAALSDLAIVNPTFTADTAGEYTATLVVNDGNFDSAPNSVNITAVVSGDNAPIITSSPVTSSSLGGAYSYDVEASDIDAGDTLTFTLLTAPTGMTIDSATGVISWVPDATGPADVDVQVTDSSGLTDRQLYLILVNGGDNDQPPTLEPIADQFTVAGNTLTLTAVGLDPENETLRYSLNVAPDGLVINSATGEVQWSPTSNQLGSAAVTVTVQDPGGQTAQQSFSVEVDSEAPNNRPELAAISDVEVDAQEPVAVTLMATDEDINDILTFALEGVPATAQFDALAGRFNWVPTSSEVGSYDLTASVTDSAGSMDSREFTITVLEPPLAPAAPVAVNDAYAIKRGDVLNVAPDGVLANDTDANGDVLTATNTSEPTLGTLNQFGSDGSFSYATPTPPPIEIGLATQCSGEVTGSSGGVPLVADMDGDGFPEIINLYNPVFSQVSLQIRNGTTCEVINETTQGFDPEYGLFSLVNNTTVGDLDGDGDLELLVGLRSDETGATDSRHFAAFDHELNYLWTSDSVVNFDSVVWIGKSGLTIADLDGDGSAEILLAYSVPFGTTGNDQVAIAAFSGSGEVLWESLGSIVKGFPARGGPPPVQIADLDLDGTMELLYHTDVFSHTGALEFSWPVQPPFFGGTATRLTVAVANFDADPYPEIVGRDRENLYLFNHDGSVVWQQPNVGENLAFRFPITVADIDGDGEPEIVYPGASAEGGDFNYTLRAFEGDGTIRWTSTDTRPNGTHTNVHAFDFDADGSDELVYLANLGGEFDTYLKIVNGTDGVELVSQFVGRRFSNDYHSVAIADTDNDGAAEIVHLGSDSLGNLPDFLQVFEGLPGNPFAPAPPIYNQWGFQPNLANPDGTPRSNPTPHWLVPGLNGNNLIAVVPGDPGSGGEDSFTYIASDDTADSNEATVNITITPNVNPPLIVSQPPLGASPGFEYEYGVLSTDADFGDILSYTLIDAPFSMSINSFGILSWTPPLDATGTESIYLVVTDSQNNTDTQLWDIAILPPVVVPDLSGLDAMMAGDELAASGLAIGSVTQNFSLTVPAGEVISQSIMAGANSAAGAFVNIVISLGPQPVFVPTLAGLEQGVAQNNLVSLGLQTGNVTFQNSDTAPKGTVISQAPLPNVETVPGAAIDLLVSSGPVASIYLSGAALAPNDMANLEIAFFDNLGNPASAPADVSIVIESADGAQGTLPQVNGTEIQTSGDTEGAYNVVVTAPSMGVELTKEFVVFAQFGSDGVQSAYAELSGSINRLELVFAELTDAARDNDTVALQALSVQLLAERDAIDLAALRRTPPIAPTEGFLPFGTVGAPPTLYDQETFPILLKDVRQKLIAKQSFLEQLEPTGSRDDDIRAAFLNRELRDAVDSLFVVEPTLNGYLLQRGLLHELLSENIPELLLVQIDVALEALGNANVLVNSETGWELNRAFAQRASSLVDNSKDKRMAAERQLFFTLGGLMSATQVQTTIINDVYAPVIKRVVLQATLLVLDDLIREFMDVTDLAGITTLGSLSFHFFEAGNSVIEVPDGPLGAGRYLVTFIGPDLPQGIADAVEVLSGGVDNPPTNLEAAEGLVNDFESAISSAAGGVESINADEDLRGCFLSSDPTCHQLVFDDGFPVVFTLGDGIGAGLPAPVLIYVYDVVNGSIYATTQAFYPMPATSSNSQVGGKETIVPDKRRPVTKRYSPRK